MKALLGANKKGVVYLVASSAGLSGFYARVLYCASKAAVLGFAKSMGMADQEGGQDCMHLS
jgi:NAD(P)-dependent dehydrogenase (short-subunit alcohol dehydrogenase family)